MSSLTKEERWYLGNGVSKFVKADGTPYYQIIIGDFPSSKFEEWDADCKKNFSDCRWAKMASDHTKARMFDLMVEQKFSIQAEQKKESPKKEVLIGGEELE